MDRKWVPDPGGVGGWERVSGLRWGVDAQPRRVKETGRGLQGSAREWVFSPGVCGEGG